MWRGPFGPRAGRCLFDIIWGVVFRQEYLMCDGALIIFYFSLNLFPFLPNLPKLELNILLEMLVRPTFYNLFFWILLNTIQNISQTYFIKTKELKLKDNLSENKTFKTDQYTLF